MQWRRFLTTIGMTLVMVMGLSGAMNLAQASPRVVFGPPAEGTKVVLADTSIDGPAIAATYHPQTVLAWTGTDAQHHLNLMTSNDGLHYSNKRILPELSLWRPAVAFIDTGRGAPYGTIVLAWTGTDAAHTLNLEFISTPDYRVTQKITYWGETSFTAPALATINGDVNSDIYLAWAGTDVNHTLNVIHHSLNPSATDKHTLWGWSSISRPSLSTDQSPNSTTALLMAWTGVNNHLYFAATADRVHWTMPKTSPLSTQSAWAPSMIGFYATNMPTHWLAWTGSGTTSTQRMSVQYTESYPSWASAGSTTTLSEWAISSPALAYDGNSRQVLLGWSGTDLTHHLNVAVVYVNSD